MFVAIKPTQMTPPAGTIAAGEKTSVSNEGDVGKELKLLTTPLAITAPGLSPVGDHAVGAIVPEAAALTRRVSNTIDVIVVLAAKLSSMANAD
jgi:hypothetical protein